jgi:hypothetical protein
VAGFGATYFVALAGYAVLERWLPADRPFAWAGFATIYLVLLAILTVAFTVAFRRRKAEYQEVLDRFHRERRWVRALAWLAPAQGTQTQVGSRP